MLTVRRIGQMIKISLCWINCCPSFWVGENLVRNIFQKGKGCVQVTGGNSKRGRGIPSCISDSIEAKAADWPRLVQPEPACPDSSSHWLTMSLEHQQSWLWRSLECRDDPFNRHVQADSSPTEEIPEENKWGGPWSSRENGWDGDRQEEGRWGHS